MAIGVKDLLEVRKKPKTRPDRSRLPTFSIIVPVKDEGRVVKRLLEALERLDYPKDKKEVIIVEDGSGDNTLGICRQYLREHVDVAMKIVTKSPSNGKPSALNCGMKQATGEIIAVFDADNVPASDALLNVYRYFEDPDVAAVQGRTAPINAGENMLTRFAAYEDLVWYEVYMRGKDSLDLFVHLRGSCQFIRRSVLEELRGFDEHALSEDMELSARIAEKGYRIRYASDAVSYQESPSNLIQLFRQRTRWYRGTMEVALRYGRLMVKPNVRRIDAEATLFGPFMLILSIVAYLGVFFSLLFQSKLDSLSQIVIQSAGVSATLTLLACGLALVFASRPRRVRSIFWLVFIYAYWFLQAFVAAYAFLNIVLRRRATWSKTEKTGVIKPTRD